MPEENQPGPLLADTEDVYRAILYPGWWSEERKRPSTAAFADEVFSVDAKSRTTPQQTAARYRNVNRLAEFNCGEAKSVGFEARDEPDLDFPENLAHAHVYCLGYNITKPSDRKAKARKLAEICKEVLV